MAARKLDPSLVRDFDIFRQMSDDDLDAALATASARRLPEGTVVFSQGAMAEEFFILLHGRLKVVQTTADGQQVVVRHVNPGEVYGIAMAVGRDDYPATATAVAESLTLAWPNREWNSLIARSPALSLSMLQTVGQRLQDAHTRIRELSTEAVERRVAHALLRLVRQAGKRTEEGILIDFPITRQDIAEMTGTTLHTVSRILTAWEGQGLVAGGRKKIVVCDAHRLFLLAEAAD
ncbi:Crp/Fnr family transcriptional regulator [Consotaella salsifontis]|uniref:cAMP-binding domain of CRP or a regulatory subunit of cAMP-dependent protein kinases n=1 Tax=Consotaella salsifontis TaxID=1365950 RepID=A0A1T4NIK1_9HYPH|nr:Crp/Fnr family transcriptional regulator [Consotaella salsifontis]SJZ79072.1 cAMP-binding domain of CRP or a regulatory subunit of cAMP-dependent protein kinases [Consotaella salsifontis]